jgi:microcystin-dependent protein
MFESLDIKDIILGVLVILVIYLIYKTRNMSEKFEKFDSITTPTTTVSPIVAQAIANTYKVDLDAMRNLGQLAGKILTSDGTDTLTLPASTVVINGNVKFTNKDTLIMEIFPKYMVIAWAGPILPLGWAPCTGFFYILDSNNNYQIATSTDTGAILTPDLRGRFILGTGQGSKDMNGRNLTNREVGLSGGEETHILTLDEMPNHSHDIGVGGCEGNCPGGTNITFGSLSGGAFSRGNDQPHNNMPPYHILSYIMKL